MPSLRTLIQNQFFSRVLSPKAKVGEFTRLFDFIPARDSTHLRELQANYRATDRFQPLLIPGNPDHSLLLHVHAGKRDASSNHQPHKQTSHGFDSIYEAPLGAHIQSRRKRCSNEKDFHRHRSPGRDPGHCRPAPASLKPIDHRRQETVDRAQRLALPDLPARLRPRPVNTVRGLLY